MNVILLILDDVAQIVEAEYGEFPEELDELLESIVDDVDVKSAGEALNAVAKYVEGESVTQNDVDDIVNGIANNMHILQMIGITDLPVVETETDAEMFKTAIENANLTQEDITTIKNLFGLN